MSITYNKLALRAKADQYCKNTSTAVTRQLGFGTQGMVFKTQRNTAIEVYNLEDGYKRERDAYLRLKQRKIQSIRGLTIPRLMRSDDKLYAFEMSIVHVPCIIDFGGAYLDIAPEHLVRDEIWHNEKEEEFGDHWEEAKKVILEIEHLADIWLSDVNTGNIKFS